MNRPCLAAGGIEPAEPPHGSGGVARIGCLGPTLSFLLLACGAGPIHPTRVEPAPRCWLVWTRTATEAASRTVCAGEEASAAVAGMHVLVDGERFELVVREERAPHWSCDGGHPVAAPGEEVVGRTLELRGVGTVTLLPLPDLSMQREVEDDIEVLGSLGPFVAVRRTLWQATECAAHLYGRTDYVWLDLRTNDVIDPMASRPADRREVGRALLPRVQAELEPDEYGVPSIWAEERRVMVEGGVESEAEADALFTARLETLIGEAAEVQALVPFWDGEAVRGRHYAALWYGDCCPPIEAFLPLVELPAPLDEWATPPPEVARLVTEDVMAFGYAEVPASR